MINYLMNILKITEFQILFISYFSSGFVRIEFKKYNIPYIITDHSSAFLTIIQKELLQKPKSNNNNSGIIQLVNLILSYFQKSLILM